MGRGDTDLGKIISSKSLKSQDLDHLRHWLGTARMDGIVSVLCSTLLISTCSFKRNAFREARPAAAIHPDYNDVTAPEDTDSHGDAFDPMITAEILPAFNDTTTPEDMNSYEVADVARII